MPWRVVGVVLGFLVLSVVGWAQESLVVISNEFGQGKAGNAEWVELLVVGTGPCSTVDMRGWWLYDLQGYKGSASPTRVRFRDVSAWAAVPAGTIIVIYNGAEPKANFPDHFPADDLDFMDYRVVIPSTNTAFFADVAWGGLANAGDWVVLVDSTGAMVDGLSCGDKTAEAGAPEVKLGAVAAGKAAWYMGTTASGVNLVANWTIGSDASGGSTPGAPNNAAQMAWITGLRPRSAISVLPASHDFGEVLVGAESPALVVTVANTGCADLLVGTVTLGGADPDQFRIQNDNCSGRTITSGNSPTLEVVFRPTAVGPKSATLSIPSNDPGRPIVVVSLSGTGKAPPLSAEAGGPYTGVVGLPVLLTGSAAGGALPYAFAWDLDGDGEYDDAVGASVSWTWGLPGTHVVGLRVTDSLGGVAMDTAQVQINPAAGDANLDGVVDVRDVRLIHQAALGLILLSPMQRWAADVDGDGDVDMDDVRCLARWLIGLTCP